MEDLGKKSKWWQGSLNQSGEDKAVWWLFKPCPWCYYFFVLAIFLCFYLSLRFIDVKRIKNTQQNSSWSINTLSSKLEFIFPWFLFLIGRTLCWLQCRMLSILIFPCRLREPTSVIQHLDWPESLERSKERMNLSLSQANFTLENLF